MLVVAVALFLRSAITERFLPGFNEDEAWAARNSARFATGVERLEPFRLFPHGISQETLGGYQPGYYYAWSSALLRALGWSMEAWRITSVALSLGMVLLLYPFGARLFGERRAFLAALLLAASRWHASDGRWGWVVVFAALLGLAGLLLVELSARRDDSWPALAGGVLLGLAVPCYGAAAPVALAAGLLLLLPRTAPRALASWAGGLAIGLLPMMWMALSQPEALLARARAASLLADAGEPSLVPLFLAGNVIRYAGLFLVSGDPLSWHTLARTPTLDAASGLAFVAGLVLVLRHPARRSSLFALVLLGAPLAAGLAAQTTDAPNQYRVGLAAPAAALLAAIGTGVAGRVLRRRWSGARFLPAAVVVGSLILNARLLLLAWPSHPGSFDGYGGLYSMVAVEVEAIRSAGGNAVVSPGLVTDRLRLDLALARTLDDAAAAGERSRIPYALRPDAPEGGTLLVPASTVGGEPRTDRWGRVLYRVIPSTSAP